MTTVSRCARAEGIPNIKVFNLDAKAPLPLMTGDTTPAIELAPKLEGMIATAGAAKDGGDFFLAPHSRVEL